MNKSKDVVYWEAKEYIQRKRNAGWYVAIIVVVLGLTALGVWLKQWTFIPIPIVGAAALILMAVRPPRTLKYELGPEGLKEGNNLYKYEDFKSFGVVKNGEIFSIVMTPKKRFSPRVEIYFPQEQGEAIVDMFGARMPMEEIKLDFLDKIVKFLRF